MKLIVMVPCLNEEHTLPQVIKTIPSEIAGISSIETLIIDDGSTDRTIEIARRIGVDHVVKLKHHLGLARAFQAGLDACLDLGADIIVNTDGDNQYPSQAIPHLVAAIVRGEADLVVGDRQTHLVSEFSPLKKILQRSGSWAVKKLSGASEVKDAVSGFRAYSRYAASRLYLTNSYSYTIESLIQSAKRGLRIISVPINTNPKTRPSRLFRSIRGFVVRSGTTLVKSYLLYEPLKTFFMVAGAAAVIGVALGSGFVFLQFSDPAGSHLLWLVLTILFLAGSVVLGSFGLLADHVAANRKLLEELVWREKASSHGLLNSTLGAGTLRRDADFSVAEVLSFPQQREVAAPASRSYSEPAYQPDLLTPDFGRD
jgi:glycosyltransferase involved in cell wall biosynthesis